jgi:hypothetical protein
VLVVSARAAQALLGADPAQAAVGAPGRTVRGTVAFRVERSPADNVVAILDGSDARLRGSYVALGAHNDHIGTNAAPVDHDSLKAFNAAARRLYMALDPEGDEVIPPRPSSSCRRSSRRSASTWTRCARCGRPASDSIANGADDDGSGSMALLEIAENVASLGLEAAPLAPVRLAHGRGERDWWVPAGSPTTRRCRATRSSRSSTST